MSKVQATVTTARQDTRRPRIGCLGVGWIGRSRMDTLARSGVADVVVVADADAGARDAIAREVPQTELVVDLPGLLAHELDGIVIATPSALHAEQAIQALERGMAVFCQKPLGRDHAETERVVAAARASGALLGVDLSYRHTDAARALHDAVAGQSLGTIHAVDLVFHNAYGPDKPWFTQRQLSGGGCLLDLGTHLIDLALWLTASTTAGVPWARLSRRGRPLASDSEQVEDFALVQLDTDTGVTARLACSWFLPAGRDCVFECTLYGTDAAVSMRNVDGSFYDFVAERYDGTRRTPLTAPGEDWGGRAIVDWARRLGDGEGFTEQTSELTRLAGVLDRIYAVTR